MGKQYEQSDKEILQLASVYKKKLDEIIKINKGNTNLINEARVLRKNVSDATKYISLHTNPVGQRQTEKKFSEIKIIYASLTQFFLKILPLLGSKLDAHSATQQGGNLYSNNAIKKAGIIITDNLAATRGDAKSFKNVTTHTGEDDQTRPHFPTLSRSKINVLQIPKNARGVLINHQPYYH